jgi:hypothetical protein
VLASEYGLEDVTIYGLGGLNEQYVEVIGRYAKDFNSVRHGDLSGLDFQISLIDGKREKE